MADFHRESTIRPSLGELTALEQVPAIRYTKAGDVDIAYRDRAPDYSWPMASSTLSLDARRAGSEAAIRPAIVAITT